MRTKAEIFAEIHKLIDEQLALLESRVDPYNAAQYIQKKRRIDELLAEIARDEYRYE